MTKKLLGLLIVIGPKSKEIYDKIIESSSTPIDGNDDYLICKLSQPLSINYDDGRDPKNIIVEGVSSFYKSSIILTEDALVIEYIWSGFETLSYISSSIIDDETQMRDYVFDDTFYYYNSYDFYDYFNSESNNVEEGNNQISFSRDCSGITGSGLF